MNRLSTEKRAQIIGCLVEGNSIRATARMTGAAKNTITKLLAVLELSAGSPQGKYSPPVCTGTKRRVLKGDPDPDRISTSYVERQNLTMRMGMRRFTRLTNGFSRKVENLAHAVSLHFMHYNFARPHATLRERYPRTPAMAAGVTDHIWTLEEIATLLD
jgi:hypothetical protein